MSEIGHNSRAAEVTHDGEPGVTSVEVSLPVALLRLFPGAPNRTTVHASTVAEVIAALDREWPGMRDRLTDTRPSVRRHINVFVDGERANLETPVRAGQRITILTAMSGG